MNNSSDPFYRHSGQFGPVGIVMMLGFGAGAGAVVGAIYGMLIFWIPFVYLNFIGTIGVAAAAGAAVYMGAVVGKVRNPMLCGLAGVTAGFVALWAAWVGWIYVLTADSDMAVIVLRPSALWDLIVMIGAEGVWSIGRSSSEPVSGTVLYIVWIIEAVMIVGGSAFIAYVTMSGKAFCERCNCWVSNKIELPKLKPPQDENALDGLVTGDVSGILTLERGSKRGRHIQVELLGCRTCDEMYLIDVSVVSVTKDKKGKDETNSTHLVSNLRLSAADYQALREFKGVAAAPTPAPAAAGDQ